MVLLGDVGQVEARCDPFGDSVSIGAGLLHDLRRMYNSMKIILGILDGTPRWHWSSGSSFQSV
jgi:hypothetical protein